MVFRFFRRGAVGVGEIELVVKARLIEVHRIALLCRKSIHPGQRFRLVVVRAEVHTLDTEALIVGEELDLGEILFLFGCRFPDRPVELFPGHELRQAEHGCPVEAFLPGPRLFPQPFQRRHYEVKVTVHPVTALLAHLDGVEQAIQQLDGCFVLACRVVGVALPLHCGKGHGWHGDKLRLTRWLVECLIFLLIIKRHRR